MNLIKLTLLAAWIGISIFLCYGCSHKEYLRRTITTDPNGVITCESVHFSHTAIATDTSLGNVSIESGERKIVLNDAIEEQDSLRASAVVGGVPVIIETD